MQRHGDRDLRRRPDPDGPADERSGGGVVGTPNWGWRGHFFGWLRVRARRVWAGANNEWIGSPWEPHNIIMMNWIGSPWEQLATGSDRHGSTPGGGGSNNKTNPPPAGGAGSAAAGATAAAASIAAARGGRSEQRAQVGRCLLHRPTRASTARTTPNTTDSSNTHTPAHGKSPR